LEIVDVAVYSLLQLFPYERRIFQELNVAPDNCLMPNITKGKMINIVCLLYITIESAIDLLFQVLSRIGTEYNFINLGSVLRSFGFQSLFKALICSMCTATV
jgi:hypothetical protein